MSLLLRLRADAPPQPPATDAIRAFGRPSRRWYEIGDKLYWLDDHELRSALVTLLRQPEQQEETPRKLRKLQRRSKRASEAPKSDAVVHIPHAIARPARARFEAMRADFLLRDDAAMIASLLAAYERLIDDDDDEVLLLL